MSMVNMEAMMTELTAMEQLAKIRLERIQELKDMIKSRRDMAQAFKVRWGELKAGEGRDLEWRASRLNAEADDLQRRLDALLAEPLGDFKRNGEVEP